MPVFPQQSQPAGENLGKHNYDSRFLLNRANLATNLLTFVGGSQDDGWFYDVAASSQVDIYYVDVPSVDVNPAPAGPDDPEPPAHQAPNAPVSEEIAARYAVLSMLLAEFGIDLGNPGANNAIKDAHYNWSKIQYIPNIEYETVRKIRLLAKKREVFPSVYAMLSTEMAKMLDLGHPGANSLQAVEHYNYAKGNIDYANSTAGIRNMLIEKIYKTFETSPTMKQATMAVIAPEIFQNLHASVGEILRDLQPGRGLKRVDLRPDAAIIHRPQLPLTRDKRFLQVIMGG